MEQEKNQFQSEVQLILKSFFFIDFKMFPRQRHKFTCNAHNNNKNSQETDRVTVVPVLMTQ